MKSRNTTIDIAKGIGIILVVIGHNWSVLRDEGEIYRIIFSFHIPLFLFITGIFIKGSESLGSFVRSKTDSITKPFLAIILLLSILRVFGLTDISNNTASGPVLFIQLLYATHGYITLEWLPLWYMPHVFLSLFISKIVLQATSGLKNQKNWVLGISIIFLTGGIWFVNSGLVPDPRPPFTSDVLPISSALIMFGFLLKDQAQSINFKLPLFLSSIVAFVLLHIFFNEFVDLGRGIYSGIIISTLQIALGIYITISTASILNEYTTIRRFFAYIGTASLFIMMFHNFAQVKTYWTFLGWGYSDQPSNVISFIAGLVFPLLLWEISKRQWILSKLLLPAKMSHRKRDTKNELHTEQKQAQK